MKNRDLIFLIIVVVVAAVVLGVWWQQETFIQEQQPPEGPSGIAPAPQVSDKTDDIQASLNEIDLGDLDAEFEELDQDINSL